MAITGKINGQQLELSSTSETAASTVTFNLSLSSGWTEYDKVIVRAEQDDIIKEQVTSENSATIALGVGTWKISVIGRIKNIDVSTNKVSLYVDRPDIHHVISQVEGNQLIEQTDGIYLGYPNVSDYAAATVAAALTGDVDFCNFYGLRFVNIDIANEGEVEFAAGTQICDGLNLPEKEVHQSGFTITTAGVLSKDAAIAATNGTAKALLVYV